MAWFWPSDPEVPYLLGVDGPECRLPLGPVPCDGVQLHPHHTVTTVVEIWKLSHGECVVMERIGQASGDPGHSPVFISLAICVALANQVPFCVQHSHQYGRD